MALNRESTLPIDFIINFKEVMILYLLKVRGWGKQSKIPIAKAQVIS